MRSMLFLAVCNFAVSLTAPASANPTSAKKANTQALKTQSGAISARAIAELETVRAQLNKANHDYKGHRAAAVNQVTHAIHILQHGKNHPNPGQHFTPAKGNNEPQQVSDAQLRLAIQELQQIALQLHGSAGQHHAAATTAIKRAIYDLQLALKVA